MSAFGYGFRTLFGKEVRRFLRVPGQTIVSPLLTTTLYFVVFGLTVSTRAPTMGGVPYARFIAPGLVMLGIVSNSLLNSSSSMFMMKMQGTIVDLLVTPLSYLEILAAFVLAAAVRGAIVGVAMWLVAGLFTSFEVVHPLWALVFVFLVGTFFGALGLLVAIWGEKFEHVNIIPTFVVTPLTFLGGVFYSIDRLPPALRRLSLADPVLYMVEGLRHAVLGASDVGPWTGLGLLVALNGVVLALGYRWLRTGYKLRS